MTEQQILGLLNNLNEKINYIENKLSDFISTNDINNKANIDYIALMSDIELPSDEDKIHPKEDNDIEEEK